MFSQFGPYEIKDKIASGGMATLYLGVHSRLESKVAIKVLPPALSDDPSYIARFEREAKIASSLRHENIVSVIDFGMENDVYFIAMEYVEGGDLRSVLDRVGKVPAEVALAIIEEVAYGLRAAHESNVIHRDLKPGNILLSETGGVKIGDFGLSLRLSDYERLTRITTGDSTLGTPFYMSPEQVLGKELDQRSDIYSLGALFYELITGEKAFQDDSPIRSKERILGESPPSVRKKNLMIPSALDRIVGRMMAKEREDRYQDIGALLLDLEGVKGSLEDAGFLVGNRRRYLTEMTRAPEEFAAWHKADRIETHARRAGEFLARGPDGFARARHEFDMVLLLDPENKAALEGVRELRGHMGVEETRLLEDVFPDAAAGEKGKGDVVVGAGGFGRESGAGDEGGPPPGKTGESGAPAGSRWDGLRLPLVAIGVVFILASLWMFRPDTGTLLLQTDPPGASVALREVGSRAFRSTGLSTPCEIDLPPGSWEVRLHKDGLSEGARVVEIERGRKTTIEALLEEQKGWVVLHSNDPVTRIFAKSPGAFEFTSIEETPPCTLHIATGLWTFVLGADEMEGETLEVFVRAGEVEYSDVKLAPERSSLGWVVLQSNPVGADVAFRRPGDGEYQSAGEVTPCSLGIEPGEWEIRLTKSCYRPASTVVQVARFEAITESMRLRSLGSGTVRVLLSPLFGEIYVDGKQVSTDKRVYEGPLSVCGTHVVEVRHAKMGSRRAAGVRVGQGETVTIDTFFATERGK